MMGGHHAISGAAAWMALAGSVEIAGHTAGLDLLGLEGMQVLSGAVVATGAALLPDIDHPSATIARSAGGMSKSLSTVVGAVTGHRGATHTLLAVLAFTALTMLAAGIDWRTTVPVLGEVQVGSVLVVAVMCAFATRAMKAVRGPFAPWLVGLGSGLLVAAFAPDTAIWLPLAVGLGALVHLLGDLLTTDGIPFPTWPLVMKPSKRAQTSLWHADGNIALPILGNAGSAREWVLCGVLTLYVIATTTATAFAAAEPWAASW